MKKSLYGLKQASLNWFKKLKQGLTDQGVCPSDKIGSLSFELSQPFLIDCLLQFLGLCNNAFVTNANSC